MLRAKAKDAQADMVRNVIPAGVECIFLLQARQLGLVHAVLFAERAVGSYPNAINVRTQRGLVETVRMNGQRFNCGSVEDFIQTVNHEYEKRLVG